MKTSFSKATQATLILAGATFCLMTLSAVLLIKEPLKVLQFLPLYISLCVMFLQSRVSRMGPFVGSLNSVLYGVVFIYCGIYASAASALLFSFPLQLLTFLRWRKSPWENSTVFRRMKGWQRGLLALGLAGVWGGAVLLFRAVGSSYALPDTAGLVLGTASTVLMMLSFLEYIYLQLLSGCVSVLLYSLMIAQTPELLPFLIYAVYSLFCMGMAAVRVHQLYRAQQATRKVVLQPEEKEPVR